MIEKATLKYLCEYIQTQTWFDLSVIEKDFYITAFFQELQKYPVIWLIFKWWTCLNKVYLWYYRLSEDIDFAVYRDELKNIEDLSSSKQYAIRKKLKNEIFDVIETCFKNIWMYETWKPREDWKIRHTFDEWRMVKLFFSYDSVFGNEDTNEIKMEISMMGLPKAEPKKLEVQHLFPEYFDEPIYTQVYNINEVVSEKTRCTFGRLRRNPETWEKEVKIAIRDLFDVYYMAFFGKDLQKKWFYGFTDDRWLELFLQKNLWDINNKGSRTKDYTFQFAPWNKNISDDIKWEILWHFQKDKDYILKQVYEQVDVLHIVLNSEPANSFLDASKNNKNKAKDENVIKTIAFVGWLQELLKKYIKRKYTNNSIIQEFSPSEHLEKYLYVLTGKYSKTDEEIQE